MSEKTDKVYGLLKKVPKGKVTTYGALAKALGSRNLARFVGTCMRKNDHPDTVPCFKVLKSTGDVGNYTHALGSKEKIRRLEAEGIRVENGKVDLEKYLFKFPR